MIVCTVTRSQIISRLIDAETPAVEPKSIDWTGYNNYTTIYAWLDELLEAHPNILTSQLIGSTYQGRPIRAVKLSHKAVRIPTHHLHNKMLRHLP